MTPYLGQIQPNGFNFAARGWALCDGQLLAISSNTALFSLLGTTFGGDGRTSFGLPDLRGRSMVHVGSGPGLNHVSWGQRGGGNTNTLTVAQMPNHTHTLRAANTPGTERIPTSRTIAGNTGGFAFVDTNPDASMNAGSILANGGSQSFSIQNPYLGVYVSIALVGIFPSRN